MTLGFAALALAQCVVAWTLVRWRRAAEPPRRAAAGEPA